MAYRRSSGRGRRSFRRSRRTKSARTYTMSRGGIRL